MRLSLTLASVLLLAACASANPMTAGMNATMAQSRASQTATYNNMMASQAAAEASANRPGDEAMGCAQIETEMTVMFKDPQFVATINSMGAAAQAEQQRAQQRQAGAAAAGAGAMAAGIAGSMIPGMGWLSNAAMQAQMAATMAEIPASTARGNAMINDMSSIMPQLMRGQRLNDLAVARKCPFIQGHGVPGTAPRPQ